MRTLAYSVIHWLKRHSLRKFKNQVYISSSTRLLRSFNVKFLAKTENRNYLKIGKQGIFNNNIIFESVSGNVVIGDRCFIGAHSSIISRNCIELGNDVTIAWGVTIYDHDSHSPDWLDRAQVVKHFYDHYGENDCFNKINWKNVSSDPIKIEDRVWIGFDAVILKGVTVGEGAIIGARSVVTHNVEPYTVVVGNPAKLVKRL